MNSVSANTNGLSFGLPISFAFHVILVPPIADSIPDTPEVIHDVSHPHQRLEDGEQDHHAHVRIISWTWIAFLD
jgi:hypothetical protein